MKNLQLKEIRKIISEIEKYYDFNDSVKEYIIYEEIKELDTAEDVKEYLENLNEDYIFTNAEVIYFTNAIKYLKEEDPSLQESMEIASEYGYTLENLNSEILASLLKTRRNEEKWYEFLNEVEAEVEQILGE